MCRSPYLVYLNMACAIPSGSKPVLHRRIAFGVLTFALMLLPSPAASAGSDRELELFSTAYVHVLSMKPEKAAETFRAFLAEFPESSVKDAAMFWLGKSLISLKSYDEAEQLFHAIRRDVPPSPFLPFLEEALTGIVGARLSESPGERPAYAGSAGQSAGLAGPAVQSGEELTALQTPGKPEMLQIRIDGKTYTASQVIMHATSASFVVQKLGIGNPPWWKGDPLDDFIGERLLLDEARERNVSFDPKRRGELSERNGLSTEEAGYLGEFMIIGNIIDRLLMDDSKDVFVDMLTIKYSSRDISAKAMLASDLQKAAQTGRSFEEIQKQFGGLVQFTRVPLQEFNHTYKERSHIVRKLASVNKDTGVVWSEKDFMLIKIVSDRPPFNPIAATGPEEKERIRAFMEQKLADFRNRAGKVDADRPLRH
jgi:hypothetical protein